jgi:hypothetical protein
MVRGLLTKCMKFVKKSLGGRIRSDNEKKVTSDRLRGATGKRSMLIIVEVDFYARLFCRFSII